MSSKADKRRFKGILQIWISIIVCGMSKVKPYFHMFQSPVTEDKISTRSIRYSVMEIGHLLHKVVWRRQSDRCSKLLCQREICHYLWLSYDAGQIVLHIVAAWPNHPSSLPRLTKNIHYEVRMKNSNNNNNKKRFIVLLRILWETKQPSAAKSWRRRPNSCYHCNFCGFSRWLPACIW